LIWGGEDDSHDNGKKSKVKDGTDRILVRVEMESVSKIPHSILDTIDSTTNWRVSKEESGKTHSPLSFYYSTTHRNTHTHTINEGGQSKNHLNPASRRKSGFDLPPIPVVVYHHLFDFYSTGKGYQTPFCSYVVVCRNQKETERKERRGEV
jgi:hypothetical protein